jgi:hypothetical protein
MSVVANVTQPTPGVMRISPWPATLLPGFEIWLARAEIGLTAERSHNHCRLSLPLASQARRACPRPSSLAAGLLHPGPRPSDSGWQRNVAL